MRQSSRGAILHCRSLGLLLLRGSGDAPAEDDLPIVKVSQSRLWVEVCEQAGRQAGRVPPRQFGGAERAMRQRVQLAASRRQVGSSSSSCGNLPASSSAWNSSQSAASGTHNTSCTCRRHSTFPSACNKRARHGACGGDGGWGGGDDSQMHSHALEDGYASPNPRQARTPAQRRTRSQAGTPNPPIPHPSPTHPPPIPHPPTPASSARPA